MTNKVLRTLVIIFSSSFSSLFAQDKPQVVPLWPNGAPGFENRRNEPEEAKDWWIKNIHNPSLVVFMPTREKANGTAVVICPGGGHRELVFNPEGRDPALFLNSLGVTVFVLKYRLARTDTIYKIEKHVRDDVFRAMRLVRTRAREWNIDPNRIGIMGFSAGGEVAAMVAYDKVYRDPLAADPIDQAKARPDFQILIYPGPLNAPESVPASAPPAFLVAASDDACCSPPVVKTLQAYNAVGIPIEVHMYARGGHAFNMGDRSKLNSIKTWPNRLADWLEESGYLVKTRAK